MVDVLLSDKTGTLTMSKMTLRRARSLYHGDRGNVDVTIAKFLDGVGPREDGVGFFADLGAGGLLEKDVAEMKAAGAEEEAAIVQQKLDAGRR